MSLWVLGGRNPSKTCYARRLFVFLLLFLPLIVVHVRVVEICVYVIMLQISKECH